MALGCHWWGVYHSHGQRAALDGLQQGGESIAGDGGGVAGEHIIEVWSATTSSRRHSFLSPLHGGKLLANLARQRPPIDD